MWYENMDLDRQLACYAVVLKALKGISLVEYVDSTQQMKACTDIQRGKLWKTFLQKPGQHRKE